jgi:hypothetical protein
MLFLDGAICILCLRRCQKNSYDECVFHIAASENFHANCWFWPHKLEGFTLLSWQHADRFVALEEPGIRCRLFGANLVHHA